MGLQRGLRWASCCGACVAFEFQFILRRRASIIVFTLEAALGLHIAMAVRAHMKFEGNEHVFPNHFSDKFRLCSSPVALFLVVAQMAFVPQAHNASTWQGMLMQGKRQACSLLGDGSRGAQSRS